MSLGGCKPMQLSQLVNEKSASVGRLHELENGKMDFAVNQLNKPPIAPKPPKYYQKGLKFNENISKNKSLKIENVHEELPLGDLDSKDQFVDPERYTMYRFKTQRKLQIGGDQKEEEYGSFRLMNPKGDKQTTSLGQMILKSDIPKDLLSLKNYKFLSDLVLKDTKHPDIIKLTELIISIPTKITKDMPQLSNLLPYKINMAVDVLEKDLDVADRVWGLGVLQLLQSFLPQGQLHPIILDFEKGFTRGEFEMLLLKDLNLQFVNVGRFVEGSIPETIDDTPVLGDSLARGKLFSEINLATKQERFTPSDNFAGIYNTLLTQKSPLPTPIAHSLVVECFDNMMNRDISTMEKLSTMNISEYLFTEKFGEHKDWQKSLFQGYLSKYLNDPKGSHLLQGLLSPFVNFDHVNDTDIETVLKALEKNKFKTSTEVVYCIHTLKVASKYNKEILSHLSKNQEIIQNSINFLSGFP